MKLFNFPAAKNTSDIVLVLRTASLTGKALDNLRRELRALATAALTLAGVATAWSPRDPQHIDAFLKANITQGETVLADFKTYYALRANGSRPLLPTYLPAIRPEEQSAVTALIIKESDASAVQSTLGGAWQPTGATPPRPLPRVAQTPHRRTPRRRLHPHPLPPNLLTASETVLGPLPAQTPNPPHGGHGGQNPHQISARNPTTALSPKTRSCPQEQKPQQTHPQLKHLINGNRVTLSRNTLTRSLTMPRKITHLAPIHPGITLSEDFLQANYDRELALNP